MWRRAFASAALTLFGAMILVGPVGAQDSDLRTFGAYHLDTAVQGLITETEQEAVGLVFDLFKNQEEVFWTNCSPAEIHSGRCNIGRSTGWLFDLSPDVRVNTGTEDAFQSIVGKISGNFMVFSLESLGPDVSPVPLPDLSKLVHVFPISAGVETTADADTLNVIGEIGYVPFHFGSKARLGGNELRLGINPRWGVFLQGGQKVRQEAEFATGGARDESGEQEGDGIGRLKSLASMQLLFPMRLLGFSTGLLVEPGATGWYDFVNDEVYYSLELSLGIVLLGQGGERSTLWEFTVQDGSGEPNFTEGTQFGTGLKLVY
jgi:hypothetical protein